MNITLILWAVGIALCFTFWPILGKFSGASGAWVGTLVVLATSTTTVLLGVKEMIQGPMFTVRACVLLVVAGLINGAAVYSYSVKTADPNVPTGTFIVIMTICMTILTPLLDWLMNGSVLSVKQCAGIVLAVVSIYLLSG